MKVITQNRVKILLHYEPKTGVFTWIISAAKRIKVGDVAGTINNMGYRSIGLYGRIYLAHRLAWLYVYGEFPPDQIDHINGITGDNRIVNLRAVDATANMRNQKKDKRNTSGITGVHWYPPTKKWQSRIKVGKRNIHLGYFECKYRAASYRKLAEEIYGFSKRHGE